MPVLDATGLLKTYANRTILRDATLTLRRRERVGLVGNNGSGKSTLARVLAGLEAPDGGEVARRRGTRVEYLSQDPALPAGASVREVVLESLSSWVDAKKRYDELTTRIGNLGAGADETQQLIEEQARAADELERQGGWDRVHEAESTLANLGINDPDRPVDSLSGGERRRVALARLLVAAPDLAILDEPTNHLDVTTIEWLEETLVERFPGAVLLITHDRAVLDRVTDRTLELHEGTLTSYAGGYARYLEARAERMALEERSERNRQNFLRREVEWLHRQPKARGTKQKARIGRAEAALGTAAPKRERTAVMRAEATRQGKTILSLSGVSIEREGRRLVDGLDLELGAGQRLGVIGPNGGGKTSLLLALLEQLPLAAGHLELGTNTRVGYLDQTRSGLEPHASVQEAVAGDVSELEIAGERLSIGAYLERFLFDRRAQRVKTSELSGGERARVCLARLLWQKSNLLLLDEPTNDLDVATLGALEAMLVDYEGSALIVSHDRWFLDRVATSLLVFEGDGRVEVHAGGYSDYRERRDAAANESPAKPRAKASPASQPPARSKRSNSSRLSYKEERELAGLLDRIDEAETRAAVLQERLGDPETYKRDGAAVAELQASFESARDEVEGLSSRWEELEARKADAGA